MAGSSGWKDRHITQLWGGARGEGGSVKEDEAEWKREVSAREELTLVDTHRYIDDDVCFLAIYNLPVQVPGTDHGLQPYIGREEVVT